jgi:hypothetical protein
MNINLERRFNYLAEVLEDDQDRTLFETTRRLLIEVFECLDFDADPEIGVDDEGRSIAEWHDYHEYTFFSIIPYSADKIRLEGIKRDDTLFSISTTINNLKKNTQTTFFFGLNNNYAISA